MKKLEEKKEAFQFNLKPILLIIAVEIKYVISPGAYLNLALNLFVITVASQAIKNLICRYYKRDQKAGKVKPDQLEYKKQDKSPTVVVATEENDVSLIREESYVNLVDNDCSWIVDSGAAFHVTPYEHFFSSYQSGDFGNVKMWNQVSRKIIGIGDVTLITNTGCKLMLKYVRRVPDIHLNLISGGKLDDVSLVNHFGVGIWKLTKGSLIVARGKKEGSLYFMEGKLCKGRLMLLMTT